VSFQDLAQQIRAVGSVMKMKMIIRVECRDDVRDGGQTRRGIMGFVTKREGINGIL